LAGAIILPDGALLRLRDGESNLWKINPGLAFVADLSAMYQCRCMGRESPSTGVQEIMVLDLARLLPDDALLQTPVSVEAYEDIRRDLIGQLPIALDAFWQQMRSRRGDFLDALMHQLSHGYNHRPILDSESYQDIVEQLFSGKSLDGARLELEQIPVEARVVREAYGIATGKVEEVPF